MAAIQQALTDYLVDDTIAVICQYAKQLRVLMLGGIMDRHTKSSVVWYDPSTGKWDTEAARWGDTRSFAVGAVVGDALYISGGLTVISGICQRHQSVDLRTWQCTELANLPRFGTKDHLLLADSAMKSLFLLSGSTDLVGRHQRASLHCYNLAHNTWSEKAQTNHSHFGHAGVVCGTSMFAIGGLKQKAVERYDPTQDRWFDCAPLSSHRHGCCAAAVVDDHSILVCGGITEDDVMVSSCEVYSTTLDQWAPVASMLVARKFASAVFIEGQVMVCGGESASFINHNACISAETYNRRTGVWTSVSPMPCSRMRAIAVVV
jgi:kelch-like protein 9/13